MCGVLARRLRRTRRFFSVSAESARSAWEICGVLAHRLRRIRRFFLYLRNPRDLRGKCVASWHADYAEYADSFLYLRNLRDLRGKFPRLLFFVTFLSKLFSSPLIIQCGFLWRKQDSFVRCYIFGPCGSLWACVLRGDFAGCAGGIHSWPSPPPQWLSWPNSTS